MRLHEKMYRFLGPHPSRSTGPRTGINFRQCSISFKLISQDGKSSPQLMTFSNLSTGSDFRFLIRPSYVLSGAAMNVVSNRNELSHFLNLAARFQNNIRLWFRSLSKMPRKLRLMLWQGTVRLWHMRSVNMLSLPEFIQAMQQLSFLPRKSILKQ